MRSRHGWTKVTCLDELNEMMHSDYAGRAAQYKMSHIDFSKLEMPLISDALRQFAVKDMLPHTLRLMCETMFQLGVTPFILDKQPYYVDGEKQMVEVPYVLPRGTYDIYVSLDPKTITTRLMIEIHGDEFERAKTRKIHIVRYQNYNGPHHSDGDIVDSPCGRLLSDYRRMKIRMTTSDRAYLRASNPLSWIQHRPDPNAGKVNAAEADASSTDATAQLVAGTHPAAQIDVHGHIHEKQERIIMDKKFNTIILPKNYNMTTHSQPPPSELFDYTTALNTYSNIVDSEFNISGMRIVDGNKSAKYMSTSVAETMRENMHKSLEAVVADLERGLRNMLDTVWPEDVGKFSLRLPFGRTLDMDTLITLGEKGIVPLDQISVHARKIARLSPEDYMGDMKIATNYIESAVATDRTTHSEKLAVKTNTLATAMAINIGGDDDC